ncbi:MAG: preprotein translocase subunit SecE [Rhizobiales bacterium]|nr:preprotein translocase subunit SecE [Hyphomicrobiales bacterium]
MAGAPNPFKFLQEVRAETAKVVWPSRKETTVTSVMVLIMVVVATLFFLVVDQVLGFSVGWLLSLGR